MTFKIREILFGLKCFLVFMQVNVTDLRSHGESGKGKGVVFFYRLSGRVSSKLVLTSSGSVSAGLLVLISTVMNSKVIYHLGLLSSYVIALINKCIL